MRVRKLGILLGIALFTAEIALGWTGERTPSDDSRGERGSRFWTGVGLLTGGVGLAVAGAALSNSNHMTSDYSGWRMTSLPSTVSVPGTHMGVWRGLNPTGAFVPRPADGFARSRSNTGSVVAMAVGASAASAGLVLVLSSRRETRSQHPLKLHAGLGWVEVAYSF